MGEQQQPVKKKPWDRQDGETTKAYAGFRAYRDLGAVRSLAAAHDKLYPPRNTGRRPDNSRCVERWCTKYGWVARCAAWDAHVEKQLQDAFFAENLKRAREQAAAAERLQGKALAFLDKVLDAEDPDPRIAATAARAYADAVKVERTIRGLAGEITQVNHADADGDKLPPPPAAQGPAALITGHLKTLLALKDAGLLGGPSGDGD